MKKIRIIINPLSGTGKQTRVVKAINKLLDNNLFDGEIRYSEQKGHLTLLAKEAVEKNYDAVVVVGGDGSINEAIQALIGTNTFLGIIPVGSGNALARHLKIPMNISKAILRINQFKSKRIDTANINGKSFVSIAGIGFDAKVAEHFSFSKNRGLWNYIKISIREYFKHSEENYRLKIDEKTVEKKAFMVVFANADQFGNNFVISPEGKIDDGLLDVCIVQKPKLYQIPSMFFKLAQKKIHLSRLVTIHRAKQINFELQNKTIVNMDGEAIEHFGEIRISINPLSLSVII